MKLSENKIETFAIELFKQQAYEYVYGPVMAPDGERQERDAYTDVTLKQRLDHAVRMLNPSIPEDARQQAVREVINPASPDLIINNETFHSMLTNGVDVEYQKDGDTRGTRSG